MTDRMPDRQQQAADRIRQAHDRTILSVPEAAERLGITPDAVRARLHRGTLAGVKEAGAWRVFLPSTEPSPSAVPAAPTGTEQATTGIQQDTDRHATDALVARLESEIDFLRSELAARTEENRRKDHLLAAALERLPALAESASASQDAQNGPGRADPVETTETLRSSHDVPVPTEVSLAVGWRRWWRKIIGTPEQGR
jgi:hypothetical protein